MPGTGHPSVSPRIELGQPPLAGGAAGEPDADSGPAGQVQRGDLRIRGDPAVPAVTAVDRLDMAGEMHLDIDLGPVHRKHGRAAMRLVDVVFLGRQREVPHVRTPRAPPVGNTRSGPDRPVHALSVEIPALTAPGVPYRLRKPVWKDRKSTRLNSS